MGFFKERQKVSFKSRKKSASNEENLPQLLKRCKMSDDFVNYCFPIKSEQSYWVSYYKSLVDTEVLHKDIFQHIKDKQVDSLQELKSLIPIENILISDNTEELMKKILTGHVVIQLEQSALECIVINAESKQVRSVSLPEVEFSVVGPKESFVESLATNLNLVRKRLPIPELKMKSATVGSLTKTNVAILYIEGVANEENVNTVVQRVNDIDIDQIIDSSYINQLITDNPKSLFPQLIDTERPDRVAAVLAEGKVVILVNGSPSALIGPTTLVEFFSAFEDYFLNPIIASVFRLIRLFSVIFSILVTPVYVAALTYHYELIPKDLLGTLITSRREVPLPPILEAIFLELTIELLREAGARLPTKIGQTIGIVGGIVIGTASVEAGLTSNVLLIIVALAALASFTTPVYQMGNTIRLIRFPFLISAHVFGLLGVVLCFCFLLAHLLRVTSLGRPFLEPIYPPRIKDLTDAFVRLPFSLNRKRPIELQSNDTSRFSKKDAKSKKDIDE